MTIQFAKGKTKFIAGIDSPQQMVEWLEANRNIAGIAAVGRSNVGKSSLINALFGKSVARVSKTPGRTRQINIFSFELEDTDGEMAPPPCPLYLFDLPGYGHASVSKEMSSNWTKLMDNFFTKAEAENITLLNIQDARHPDQTADRDFSQYISNLHFETFLLLNKVDKLKTQKERNALKKKSLDMLADYKWVKQIYTVSAEKGSGLQELAMGIISFLTGRFMTF